MCSHSRAIGIWQNHTDEINDGIISTYIGDEYLSTVSIFKKIGLSNFRHISSAVMQGDYLLSGSIAENISFFALDPDKELIEYAAKQACIYDEIKAMPMDFNTLSGDMESVLSGGQIQRVLLARAIYKKPKNIIFRRSQQRIRC